MNGIELKSNAIKSAVALALTTYIKENDLKVSVVKERKEMGFEKPTLFVGLIDSRMQSGYNRRALFTYMFEVDYFVGKQVNQDGTLREQLDDMRDVLHSVLRYIDAPCYTEDGADGVKVVKKPLKATDNDSVVSDGVLVYTFNLRVWADTLIAYDYLQQLEVEIFADKKPKEEI